MKLTGEAEGLYGPVKVEVVLDGDTIIAVTVIEHQETPGVAGKALTDIPQAILDNNGVENLDTVSGAMATSTGILEAIQNALDTH